MNENGEQCRGLLTIVTLRSSDEHSAVVEFAATAATPSSQKGASTRCAVYWQDAELRRRARKIAYRHVHGTSAGGSHAYRPLTLLSTRMPDVPCRKLGLLAFCAPGWRDPAAAGSVGLQSGAVGRCEEATVGFGYARAPTDSEDGRCSGGAGPPRGVGVNGGAGEHAR